MAFTTASGHGNLPNGNFSPIIYSKKVQLAFRKSTVCGDITNSDYFGEISAQGDNRSEERRVGKEWRSRWSPEHEKKKKNIYITFFVANHRASSSAAVCL